MGLNKKITVPCEAGYIAANLLLSFAVAMATSADFGISMIVAPAYIISQKFTFLTFGQSEYVLQGIMFIVLCIVLKRFKIGYLFSFVTCLFYGALLDMWRIIIPWFNPHITPAGSMALPVRIIFFIVSILLTAFSVAIFYRIYIPSQVYDFFVKAVSEHFSLNQTKFKICYDTCSLVFGVILTLSFFGKFVGIGFGTLIITAVNGFLIGRFGKLLDKFIEFKPFLKKFAKLCEVT